MENKKYAGPPLSNILGLILLLFPLLSMYAARKEHAPTYPVQRRPAGLEFPIPVRFLLVRIPWLPTQWSQVIYCFSAYHRLFPAVLHLMLTGYTTASLISYSQLSSPLLSLICQSSCSSCADWLKFSRVNGQGNSAFSHRRILCRVSVDLLLVKQL